MTDDTNIIERLDDSTATGFKLPIAIVSGLSYIAIDENHPLEWLRGKYLIEVVVDEPINNLKIGEFIEIFPTDVVVDEEPI